MMMKGFFMVGRISIFRILAGYIVFVVIFSCFFYKSDYVPDWHVHYSGDSPQSEVLYVVFLSIFCTPFLVPFLFFIGKILRYIRPVEKKY
jgi:hypothetical protein